jgi:regulator of sigma E protease
MIGPLAIALVLGGLIFFHELGHFLTARFLRIGVRTFSLGFGPKLLGFQSGKTQYKLSLIPLGGFVQLVGENPDEDPDPEFDRSESFSLRPAWQRMLVVAAGPIFNFVLAWLIFWVLALSVGKFELLPVIGEVHENMPAAAAGITEGDRIIKVNGEPIEFWQDMAERIVGGEGEALTLSIEREGEIIELDITPKYQVRENMFGEEERIPLIGVSSAGETQEIPMGLFGSMKEGADRTWATISLTFTSLVKIVQGSVDLENVGGPIMIGQIVTQQAQEGLLEVLLVTAIISVNLGLINLMPIPVLDGGHILFFLIESLAGRPVPEKWQNFTTRIGIAMLLAIMALAIYNDVVRLVKDSTS